jgi:tetratricopeptide (TPR) repeat protein
MSMTHGNHTRPIVAARVLLTASVLFAASAHGYSYGPQNRAEWDGWPEYCKARYVVSNIGDDTEFAQMVDADTVLLWQKRIGYCWNYLHHHCAALLQLNRAKSTRSAIARREALDSAIGEDRLAARHCPATDPFSANIATHTAMSLAEAGNVAKATQSVDWAIKNHPSYVQSYLVKASILRKAGKAADARKVLESGNEATGGSSAEIQNALGFAYLNAKDYEKARQHARRAYELGFPLPGLRDQLAAAGYPL